ncbi:MAG: sodium-dependent transporter [bacterium]
MGEQVHVAHGRWSSRLAFILAATGSAVGLGNIWKFPYIAGENGGGAFVLVYLVCVAAIGIPIMMAEVMIGRRGRLSPINTMKLLAETEGANPRWKWLGIMGVLAGFLILSYYSVIAGWALYYVIEAAGGVFNQASPEAVNSVFDGMVGDPLTLLLWHSAFMLMTMLVVARGVSQGLEKAVTVLMPGMFIILLGLLVYSFFEADFSRGVSFLFAADFSKLSGEAVLIAMGHAFFTLSLGMGAIMIYGSYLPDGVSIAKTAVIVSVLDTLVALVAGLVIFPIVFANALEPGAGPGLVFQTLPIAFGQMPGGVVIATLFFVMLVFAAWTSAISLIEPAVAWFGERFGTSRKTAAVVMGLVTWFIGVGSALSFNVMSEPLLFGKNFFDLLDFLTANVMLPLGGLFIAVFAAWIMHKRTAKEALEMSDGSAFSLWRFLVRYVTPVAVLLIFLQAIGLIG